MDVVRRGQLSLLLLGRTWKGSTSPRRRMRSRQRIRDAFEILEEDFNRFEAVLGADFEFVLEAVVPRPTERLSSNRGDESAVHLGRSVFTVRKESWSSILQNRNAIEFLLVRLTRSDAYKGTDRKQENHLSRSDRPKRNRPACVSSCGFVTPKKVTHETKLFPGFPSPETSIHQGEARIGGGKF